MVNAEYAQTGFIGNFSGGELLRANDTELLNLAYASDFDVYNESSIDINGDVAYIHGADGTRLINRGEITRSTAAGDLINCGNNDSQCKNTQLINRGKISSQPNNEVTSMMYLYGITNTTTLINRLGGSIGISGSEYYTDSVINGQSSKTAIVNFSSISGTYGYLFMLNNNTGSNMVNYGSITTNEDSAYIWNIAGSTTKPSANNHLLIPGQSLQGRITLELITPIMRAHLIRRCAFLIPGT